ncbi:MAG TPA: DGQHR domain-containing protein [Candidatus Babeliaceae bacterium]|nr:DGQHR domain-containing protein [Candidatus Babeliaceae bacterium]
MTKQYFGLKIKQRQEQNSPEFVVFAATATDIAAWAGIRRVGEAEQGIQRVLKVPRVNAIRRFFEANPQNTIPVSAVLAFGPNVITFQNLTEELSACVQDVDVLNGMGDQATWGVISFDFVEGTPEQDRPALIVDGQHRIKGMASVAPQVPIAVAAYINSTPDEQAFQFVVINNKAQKVPTDNVKAILRNIDEVQLQQRLLKAGVSYGKSPATLGDINDSVDSPFYQLLDWQLNPPANRIVQLSTIETALRYIKDVLPILSEDDDSLKSLFVSIWSGIKNCYPHLWIQNAKFFSKVNLLAMNEFIVDKLENVWVDGIIDIYSSEVVADYTKKSLEDVPVGFWETDWVHPLQDNAVIRTRIKDDLRKIPQNIRAGREWDDGLKLIAK